MTQEEYSAVCPYLGLADDADSHATYATEAHRCYRLPTPTRIASPHQESYCLGANHVTCPVYLGEGVPQTQRPAAAAGVAAGAGAAAAAGAASSAAPPEEPQVRGPRPGQRAPRQPAEQKPRRPNAGTLGPRPRAGGISMPVATIGLFALALVVVGLAFAIQRIVDDGDDDTLSPSDVVATSAALNKTQTAQAGGTNGQQTPQPSTTQTQQAGGQTPGASTTATGSRTPTTGTPAANRTHVVKAGEFCGAIAEANNVTLAALLAANNMTEADCTNLRVGQELKLP